MCFLAIDVGNTRLKWALFASAKPGSSLLAQGAVFLEAIDDLAETQWQNLPQPQAILGCIVAGSGVQRRLEEQLEHWHAEPQWVVPSQQACGVFNGYDHPSRLGADRWAALIGAFHHPMPEGRRQASRHAQDASAAEPLALAVHLPTLVVMVGTAVTVDALDASGHFLGGLILPGFGLMMRTLQQGTSGLKTPMGDVCDFPTHTGDALMSGAAQAIAGAVDRMHAKLRAHTAQTPRLLMTGGAVSKLTPLIDHPFEQVETLIFDGLLQIQAQRASVMRSLFASHFSMESTG
jgi:type III pantothenate kinase